MVKRPCQKGNREPHRSIYYLDIDLVEPDGLVVQLVVEQHAHHVDEAADVDLEPRVADVGADGGHDHVGAVDRRVELVGGEVRGVRCPRAVVADRLCGVASKKISEEVLVKNGCAPLPPVKIIVSSNVESECLRLDGLTAD